MSNWIDPIGTRALIRYIRRQQRRLALIAERHHARDEHSRTAAKCRARCDELGTVMALIQAVERPGKELHPYKELVQSGGTVRRAAIETMVPRGEPFDVVIGGKRA